MLQPHASAAGPRAAQARGVAVEEDERSDGDLGLVPVVAGGHDERFRAWTEQLRDRRRTSGTDFFYSANRSTHAKRQAEEKAPACARRWGFRMNMDLDAFRSTFDRFAHAA